MTYSKFQKFWILKHIWPQVLSNIVFLNQGTAQRVRNLQNQWENLGGPAHYRAAVGDSPENLGSAWRLVSTQYYWPKEYHERMAGEFQRAVKNIESSKNHRK